jgi:hypothetical protein
MIPPHDKHRELKSYQMAEIVHDATVVFCARFMDKWARMSDQIVQAECILKDLQEQNCIKCLGRGRNAKWHRTGN